jgi:hypothetical protein
MFFLLVSQKIYQSEVSVGFRFFLWVTLPFVTVHTHHILGLGFVIYWSCMWFLKQKSLLICLFIFLPCAMKAHLCDFCWSGVGHDIYISTVLQLFFWVAVMQVFFCAQLWVTLLPWCILCRHTVCEQSLFRWVLNVTVTVRWLAVQDKQWVTLI